MGDNGYAPEAEWEKSRYVVERLNKKPFFDEPTPENRNGSWMGRRIIGRDVRINGGVYLGGGSREAIVVDDNKQEALRQAYDHVVNRIKAQGGDFKRLALREVFDYVKQVMPYSQDAVDNVARTYDVKPDGKVGLGRYVENRGGVCRHQALLCGYLLERLVEEGKLAGKVSVDRNFVRGQGGHAWCRYTNSKGEAFILDVAQDYAGKLFDIKESNHRWVYQRPEDKL